MVGLISVSCCLPCSAVAPVQEHGARSTEQEDVPVAGTWLYTSPVVVAAQKASRVQSEGSWGM